MDDNRAMRSGFSLLELSIVLVIIGLLAGGVMTGQSLIRAAELRSVVTEYQKFRTAFNGFRDKYQALPGDMKNATSFWGTAGTCPGNSASPATSPATCNGDGDGRIRWYATGSNETYRLWQQLANAGLIEGTYTGVSSDTTAVNITNIPGTNVPASKLGTGGWGVYEIGSLTVSPSGNFEGEYGNAMVLAKMDGSNNGVYPILKPDEMWNIDTKLDDGKPGLGMMVAPENNYPAASTCHDQTASFTLPLAAAAVYTLNVNDKSCWAYFKNVL